jgi:hypothetical protein
LKFAGCIDLDRVLLPTLGTPWTRGKLTALQDGKGQGKDTITPPQPHTV